MSGTLHIGLKQQTARSGRAEWPVLGSIGLDIAGGERVAIMGPNGCGKTTLLRLICGLAMPTEGVIRLDDEAVSGPGHHAMLMFQDQRLLPWMTVRQNIAFGLSRKNPPLVTEWLERTGLTPFAALWPHQLSGGMAQRVALARALISNPQILCLDEPFAALDKSWRQQLHQDLRLLHKQTGVTLIMVTHDAEDVEALADRLIVLGGTPTRVQSDAPVG